MLQIGRSLVRSPLVSLEFFIDIKSFRSHYGPGVDSASNKNEYQEYFLWVKAAGAWGWQPYHHPVPLSWNLGTLTSWNPLGHSRPVMGLISYLVCYVIVAWLLSWSLSIPLCRYNNFVFIVRHTQCNVAKLESCNWQQSYMFQPHGTIFRLIKYGAVQGTSVITTYGIPCI